MAPHYTIQPSNTQSMDDYQLYDKIAAGRNSVMFKGRRKKSLEYYVIKKTEKSNLKYYSKKIKYLYYFKHHHILKFYQWYETNKHIWILLEYCPVGDLHSLVTVEGQLPLESITKLASEVLAAVQYLHSRNVVYLDFDPKKMLIDVKGEVKLSGFHFALKFDEVMHQDNFVQEELFFPLPPELIPDKELRATPMMDSWSFGCWLFYITFGEKPIKNEVSSYIERKVKDPDLLDLINKLLNQSPTNRLPFQVSYYTNSILTLFILADPQSLFLDKWSILLNKRNEKIRITGKKQ